MSILRVVLRPLTMTAHAVWVGGFTFYSAVVLWAIHGEYGSFDAGRITQRVTDWLNVIGAGTLVAWWLVAWLERRQSPRLARHLRHAILVVATLLLGFLMIDHRVLDDRLETYGLTGFYAYHRVYLIASTAQWAVNLAMIPVTLRLWEGQGSSH
jgi:hypothetical protein